MLFVQSVVAEVSAWPSAAVWLGLRPLPEVSQQAAAPPVPMPPTATGRRWGMATAGWPLCQLPWRGARPRSPPPAAPVLVTPSAYSASRTPALLAGTAKLLPGGKRQRALPAHTLKPIWPHRRVLWPLGLTSRFWLVSIFESAQPWAPRAMPPPLLCTLPFIDTALACDGRTGLHVGCGRLPQTRADRRARRSVSPSSGRRPRAHFAAQQPTTTRELPTRAELETHQINATDAEDAQVLPSPSKAPYRRLQPAIPVQPRLRHRQRRARPCTRTASCCPTYLGNGVAACLPTAGGASSRREEIERVDVIYGLLRRLPGNSRSAPWWTT